MLALVQCGDVRGELDAKSGELDDAVEMLKDPLQWHFTDVEFNVCWRFLNARCAQGCTGVFLVAKNAIVWLTILKIN